ncbi:uncharacterized protein LOC129910184 isoform X2 [Episyrphus balteatus]|uniref:uncharacterized protein LOC129910184 isoform X2 n=1 Tax=Episyrphus balteatus TaxID=286459 RepID=UPI00248597C0|nr:uncharacterized protein LOC129910184 isoform X2 [Episyrphus balteatus]
MHYFTKDAKPNNSSILRFVNPSGKSIDPHKYTTKPEDPSMLRFVNPSGKSFDPNIYHTRNRQFRINKKLLKKALSALTSPQGISYIIKAVKVAGFATISIDGTGLTDGQNGTISNVAEGAANKNELEDPNCEDGQNETLNQTANKTGQYVGGFVASSVGKTMGSFLIPGVGPLVGALSLGWIGVKYGPKFASKGASYINSFRIKRKFKRNNDRKRTIQSEGQKSSQKQNPRGGTHPPTFE